MQHLKPCPVRWEPNYTPIEKQEEMKNGKEAYGIAVDTLFGFRPLVLLGSQSN